ncbi:MAG: DUF5318 family protein [Actinomycetota bacterium]
MFAVMTDRRRVSTSWLVALNISDDTGDAIGGVVDHRLTRRALINEYRKGRLRKDQVCDAHPDLLRAARNFGNPTRVLCPICVADNVVLVTYVFGPYLPRHGRCITMPSELAHFQRHRCDYTAYVVETCRQCGWHHLLRSIPTGGAQSKAAMGE